MKKPSRRDGFFFDRFFMQGCPQEPCGGAAFSGVELAGTASFFSVDSDEFPEDPLDAGDETLFL
ncbi:MAG: hypothetical protein NTV54_10910 [Ignavibacteriales bacterium]|nr:hypothetical protein [Ignavibacteriales bacterium]